MKWHVDEKKGLVLKQFKSGRLSEFAAQIFILGESSLRLGLKNL
jgi:hypothetical protein